MKFTFLAEGTNPDNTLKICHETAPVLTMDEALRIYGQFLMGVGFKFKGELRFVTEDVIEGCAPAVQLALEKKLSQANLSVQRLMTALERMSTDCEASRDWFQLYAAEQLRHQVDMMREEAGHPPKRDVDVEVTRLPNGYRFKPS